MNHKWTREMIIRDILQREAAGLPLTVGGEQGIQQALYLAGTRVFGSWRNAVMAAGIPREQVIPREKWSPAKILMIIRNLSRRRQPLTSAQLERHYGDMVAAARRIFGTLTKAALAAGVDPAKLRRKAPWTRERVIEAVLTRALRNEPLNPRFIESQSLVVAGQRIFGRWAAALEAAGLDPAVHLSRRSAAIVGGAASVSTPGDAIDNGAARGSDTAGRERKLNRPNQRWSRETVVAAILARLSEQKGLNTDAVHAEHRPLYRAAKREFGSWRQALLAAGLNPDEYWRGAACRRPALCVDGRDGLLQKSQAFTGMRQDQAT